MKAAMKQTVGEHNEAARPKEQDRRKCKRVALSYPIRVSGLDYAGHMFSDLSVTTDVSQQGCRFDLLREVTLGSILSIQIVNRDTGNPHSSRASQFKVAWISPSLNGWSVGALILNPGNMWHMAFPKRVKANGS
jgi:hypothetical protein